MIMGTKLLLAFEKFKLLGYYIFVHLKFIL